MKSIERWWKVENTKVRLWKLNVISCFHHRTIVFHHRDIVDSLFRLFIIILSFFFIIVLPRFHYRTIAFSPSYYRVITIVLSRYHHRTIAFSLSYYRVITIVLSRYHHRTVVFSLSYYRLFIIVCRDGPNFSLCGLLGIFTFLT